MSNSVSRLFRNFGLLFLASLVSKILLAIVSIYLARTLGPKGFGIIGFSQAFVVYFSLLTDLGLKTVALREMSLKGREESLGDTIFTARLILTIVAFTLFSLTIYIVPIDAETKPVLTLYGMMILANGVFLDWVFMAHEKMQFVAVAEFVKSSSYAALIFLLVRQDGQQVRVPISYLIAMIIALVLLYFLLRRGGLQPRVKWDFTKMRHILRIALPLGATQICITLYSYLDQIFLGFIESKQVVGFYNAPYKIVNLGVLVLNLFVNSAIPLLARMYSVNRPLYNNVINFGSTLSLHIFFPIGFLITLFAPEIIHLLFGLMFTESIVLIKLLVWSFVLIGTRFLFENFLIISGSQKRYFKYTVLYLVSNLVFNLFLIPWLGAIGAALATVLSDLIFISILYLVMPHEFFIKYRTSLSHVLAITIVLLTLSESLALGRGVVLFAGIGAYLMGSLGYYLSNRKKIAILLSKIRHI